MKILASKQVQKVDLYTIENEPIHSINLMERAAQGCTATIVKGIVKNQSVIVFAGPGNNGGDGLAIARQLAELNLNVEVYIISKKLSSDSAINYNRLLEQNKVKTQVISLVEQLPEIPKNTTIIEALFGSGLTRPIEGFAAQVVEHINESSAKVISIDVPSGLFDIDNSNNPRDENTNEYLSVIKANHTLTLQMPFLSLLFPENGDYTGKLHIVPIGLQPEAIELAKTPYYYIESSDIKPLLKKRKKFSHKGNYGHALLVAGSYGKMGAAVLAAKACMRGGVGLLTAHIPRKGYDIMQISSPETMISIDKSDEVFSEISELENYNAIGIGPGIGTSETTDKALKALLSEIKSPMVIDADALNLISANTEMISLISENSILTPHPKEFERLVGKSFNDFECLQMQMDFAVKNKVIVVLKGAHTAIATPDGNCYFNSTGNPGMATAGSGDVLTGLILSLLAQNYSPKEAALLGVFMHGKAGDFATEHRIGNTLIASDLIDNLGNVF